MNNLIVPQTTMTRQYLSSLLGDLYACMEAQEWVHSLNCETAEEAWNLCERGDWMLWIAGKRPGVTRQRLVFAACQCARLALPLVGKNEFRPLKAIETAEAWTRDEAEIDEVRDAAHAAYAADAADAAYAAADAADAADAAYAAAYAAAHAAYAAAHAAYAAYAAERKRVLRECADIVRKHISFAEVVG